MKVVITVVGKDKPGIIANVGKRCADHNVTIVDITQKVLQDLFTMIMIVELPEETELQKFSKVLRFMSCMKIFLMRCIQFKGKICGQ